MEKTKTLDKVVSPLIDKKVVIRPVTRVSSWPYIANKNSVGSSMWPGTKSTLRGVSFDINTNKFVEPLTAAERAWFEDENGMNFPKGSLLANSPFNNIDPGKKGNFWSNYKVILYDNPLVLRLSDPMDFLKYKFLLTQSNIVAPSEDEIKIAEHYFFIEDIDTKDTKKANRTEAVMECFDILKELMKSDETLKSFIRLWQYNKNGSLAKIDGVTRASMIQKIEGFINDNPYNVSAFYKDSDYKMKLTILNLIDSKVIQYVTTANGRKGFKFHENTFPNIDAIVDFLNNPVNQSELSSLLAEYDTITNKK